MRTYVLLLGLAECSDLLRCEKRKAGRECAQLLIIWEEWIASGGGFIEELHDLRLYDGLSHL